MFCSRVNGMQKKDIRRSLTAKEPMKIFVAVWIPRFIKTI